MPLFTPARIFLFTTTLTVGATTLHYSRIRSVEETSYPPIFRKLITPRSTHGLYKRHLDRPILPMHASSTSSQSTLTSLSHALFSSKPYQLELYLSKTAPKDLPLIPGNSLGYLKVESVPSEREAILRYEYPGIDFRLYLAVPEGDRDVLLGFVDYSGDFTQDWGSRVYTPMLLESSARGLEKRWTTELLPQEK